MYYSYATFFGMLLLLLKNSRFGELVIKFWYLTFPGFIIIIAGVGVVIGYFDKKYIRPVESEQISMMNPVMTDILMMLSDIRRKLK